MHTKRKGNICQFATALFLSKYEYSIFTEEGDISKIDLIAEKHSKLLRFQCKAVSPNKFGILEVPLQKSGPGYCCSYTSDEFDLFAVYDLQSNNLYFVPSSILDTQTRSFNIRLKAPKNNQKKGIHLADDYLADKILASLVVR